MNELREAVVSCLYEGDYATETRGVARSLIHCECSLKSAQDFFDSLLVPTLVARAGDTFNYWGICVSIIAGDGPFARCCWWDEIERQLPVASDSRSG